MSEVFRARVWCVDNDIDSDLIFPIDVLPMPRLERPQHMFRANRPGWAAQVRQGDILIAGKNFGMGSGQPASRAPSPTSAPVSGWPVRPGPTSCCACCVRVA